jgi:hypothetical protein
MFKDKLFAMALKVKSQDDKTQMLYMQLDVLTELLTILKSRYRGVHKRAEEEGEVYKNSVIAATTALVNNLPEMESKDVMEPDLGNRIISLALKSKDNRFSLVALLQNDKIATLHLDDTQIEFFFLAIQRAMENVSDKETPREINALLDFLLFYYVDFSNMQKIDYLETPHEGWKQHLFSHYLGVLYCFETEQGKKILSGVVIKTSAPNGSEEEKSIILRIAALSSRMKAIQQEHQLCQYFCHIIPSAPNQMLSMDECLRPLQAFCLDMQKKLDA